MTWTPSDHDIARWRLRTQALVAQYAASAGDVVGSLLAVQAENPAQSAWAVACRTCAPDATDLADLLDMAENSGLARRWFFVRYSDPDPHLRVRWQGEPDALLRHLLPLAHVIGVHGATVDLELVDDGVEIEATVRTADRTGVEMEALTAVSVAALAVVDMVKGLDKGTSIENVRIVRKTGGKSGDWTRPGEE